MDWRLGGGVLRQGCVECFVLSHKNKREGDKENWTAEEGDEQVQKLELENGQEMKTNGPVVCVEDLRLAEATMEGKRSERAAGRGRRVRGRGRPVKVSERTCSGAGYDVGEAGWRTGRRFAIGCEGLKRRPAAVGGRPMS